MGINLSTIFAFLGLGRPEFPERSGLTFLKRAADGSPCYAPKDPMNKIKGTAEESFAPGASDICFSEKSNKKASKGSSRTVERRLSDPFA